MLWYHLVGQVFVPTLSATNVSRHWLQCAISATVALMPSNGFGAFMAYRGEIGKKSIPYPRA